MDYETLKYAHMGLAAISVAWLVARGVPAVAADWRARSKVLRIGPHVVDTLLLASGIWLAMTVGWRVADQPWLMTKLLLLVAYIGLAWVALKPWLGRPVRWGLFLLALGVFGWIAAVSFTKSPAGPLGA